MIPCLHATFMRVLYRFAPMEFLIAEAVNLDVERDELLSAEMPLAKRIKRMAPVLRSQRVLSAELIRRHKEAGTL